MVRIFPIFLLFLFTPLVHVVHAEWETLTDCELIPAPWNDGDSFRVRHDGNEYIFRLYYVDAPETNLAFPERVAEQGDYFGISPEEALEVGRDAAEFSTHLLAQGPFTVVTRWQDAMGRSDLPRNYAFILVSESPAAEEHDLAALLLSRGLVRLFGVRAIPPGADGTEAISAIYEQADEAARRYRRGAYALVPIESDHANRLNVNTASPEELRTLPGIGPSLSESIVDHRPYRRTQDLETVPGIGPTRLQSLLPLVTVQ